MGRLAVGGAIFAVLVYLSFRDLTQSAGDMAVEAQVQHAQPPEPKLKRSFMAPTIKFLYWYAIVLL